MVFMSKLAPKYVHAACHINASDIKTKEVNNIDIMENSINICSQISKFCIFYNIIVIDEYKNL